MRSLIVYVIFFVVLCSIISSCGMSRYHMSPRYVDFYPNIDETRDGYNAYSLDSMFIGVSVEIPTYPRDLILAYINYYDEVIGIPHDTILFHGEPIDVRFPRVLGYVEGNIITLRYSKHRHADFEWILSHELFHLIKPRNSASFLEYSISGFNSVKTELRIEGLSCQASIEREYLAGNSFCKHDFSKFEEAAAQIVSFYLYPYRQRDLQAYLEVSVLMNMIVNEYHLLSVDDLIVAQKTNQLPWVIGKMTGNSLISATEIMTILELFQATHDQIIPPKVAMNMVLELRRKNKAKRFGSFGFIVYKDLSYYSVYY